MTQTFTKLLNLWLSLGADPAPVKRRAPKPARKPDPDKQAKQAAKLARRAKRAGY